MSEKTKAYDRWAQAYIDAGYWPRRVYAGTGKGKGCLDEWQKAIPEVPAKSDAYEGIALRTQSPIEGGFTLGWIDVDDDRLVRLFMTLLKPKCARIGSKGIAIPVRLDRLDQTVKLKWAGASKHAVELLFGVYICVIPPSFHKEAKREYRWVGAPLLETSANELPIIDHDLKEFIGALIQNNQIETLISGQGTHDAALKMVRIVNARTDDDKLTFELIKSMLPEGYAGDTLKQLPEMIKSERAKVASGKLPKVDTQLQFAKSGKLVVCSANTRTILERMEVRVRYDEFADVELITVGEAREIANRDDVEVVLRDRMDREFGYQISAAIFRDTMMAISRENTFHPVKNYLKSLKWDGKERIGSWLIDYAEAEDSDYVREVSRVMMVAAIRRVISPGCKFDQMVVLHGEQGTGKSTAIKLLARNPDWFCDSLHMEAKDKELIEQTQGKWLIEMSELKGMHRSQSEHVKAMLSRTSDRARKAYGRITEEKARHFILIGTTNEIEFLRDETGNRRFWPVAVGRFDLERLKADRDQLWAEAYAVEQTQVPIVMRAELWDAANKIQESHRVKDNPYVDVLREKLGDKQDGRIKTSEVLKLLGIDSGKVNNPQYKTLKSAMLEIGWEYKQLMRFGNEPSTGGYIKGRGAEIIHADFSGGATSSKKAEY